MHLTDADLQQLNAERVSKLTPIPKDDLLLRMLDDLKEARGRLPGWFGVSISTSLINRCPHEAGRAVEPLEEQLAGEVRQAVLAHGQMRRPGRNGGGCCGCGSSAPPGWLGA